jgi:hypothetical protein
MGYFSPINEFVASVAGRICNELPPSKLQAITKFLRTRNRTPQKALFVALT